MSIDIKFIIDENDFPVLDSFHVDSNEFMVICICCIFLKTVENILWLFSQGDVDLWTVAQSYVYFEKIILKVSVPIHRFIEGSSVSHAGPI